MIIRVSNQDQESRYLRDNHYKKTFGYFWGKS